MCYRGSALHNKPKPQNPKSDTLHSLEGFVYKCKEAAADGAEWLRLSVITTP